MNARRPERARKHDRTDLTRSPSRSRSPGRQIVWRKDTTRDLVPSAPQCRAPRDVFNQNRLFAHKSGKGRRGLPRGAIECAISGTSSRCKLSRELVRDAEFKDTTLSAPSPALMSVVVLARASYGELSVCLPALVSGGELLSCKG